MGPSHSVSRTRRYQRPAQGLMARVLSRGQTEALAKALLVRAQPFRIVVCGDAERWAVPLWVFYDVAYADIFLPGFGRQDVQDQIRAARRSPDEKSARAGCRDADRGTPARPVSSSDRPNGRRTRVILLLRLIGAQAFPSMRRSDAVRGRTATRDRNSRDLGKPESAKAVAIIRGGFDAKRTPPARLAFTDEARSVA